MFQGYRRVANNGFWQEFISTQNHMLVCAEARTGCPCGCTGPGSVSRALLTLVGQLRVGASTAIVRSIEGKGLESPLLRQ